LGVENYPVNAGRHLDKRLLYCDVSRQEALQMTTGRRAFIAGSFSLAAAAVPIPAEAKVGREPGVKLKLGLNAFSFDKQLRSGQMTLTDTVHFCAKQGVDALDATGYYFPGYPDVPADAFVYALKRTAFLNGVALTSVKMPPQARRSTTVPTERRRS
jgi:hypothetical protein